MLIFNNLLSYHEPLSLEKHESDLIEGLLSSLILPGNVLFTGSFADNIISRQLKLPCWNNPNDIDYFFVNKTDILNNIFNRPPYHCVNEYLKIENNSFTYLINNASKECIFDPFNNIAYFSEAYLKAKWENVLMPPSWYVKNKLAETMNGRNDNLYSPLFRLYRLRKSGIKLSMTDGMFDYLNELYCYMSSRYTQYPDLHRSIYSDEVNYFFDNEFATNIRLKFLHRQIGMKKEKDLDVYSDNYVTILNILKNIDCNCQLPQKYRRHIKTRFLWNVLNHHNEKVVMSLLAEEESSVEPCRINYCIHTGKYPRPIVLTNEYVYWEKPQPEHKITTRIGE